ncbi:MAG TPA: hypothetical protein VFY13_08230, partial [Luteolibacter sp.]|nr:hypothetical protein [Luteolibacter sp.]
MNPPVIHSFGLRLAGACHSATVAVRGLSPVIRGLRAAMWIAVTAVLVLLQSRLSAQSEQEKLLLIPWSKAPVEVPVFHSVNAQVQANVGLEKVEGVMQLGFQVHQGRAKVLSVLLVGEGEVKGVTGNGIKDWSVRKAADGRRYLDIHPVVGPELSSPARVDAVVNTVSEIVKGRLEVLLPAPADATGFSLQVNLQTQAAVDVRVLAIEGLSTVENQQALRYVGSSAAKLAISVTPSGVGSGLEMLSSRLEGTLSKDGKSVKMVFNGTLRSERVGASVELLSGRVALAAHASGDGWRLALREKAGHGWVLELVAEKVGEMPVSFEFLTPVIEADGWQQVDFSMPPGVVVPVELKGFSKEIEFSPANSVVPRTIENRLSAFMPATGRADIAWRPSVKVADGTLFFSSHEITEVRVGSGLMRQRSLVSLRVLQGKLQQLEFDVAGRGEILGVSGNSAVVGWQVVTEGNQRRLVVKLSRPITKQDKVVIDSQVNMEGKPLEAAAIRLSPVGTLRHSGWLRLANEGSVRLEVIGAEGLIQLAPHQFPVPQDASLRQVVVYRFPSAQYAYRVQASQVLPEVSVSEITVYELGETDLRIHSDIELDVREAPVREWVLEIPADHAVNSVSGAQIADFSLGSEIKDGRRSLNIIFKGPVIDRHLIHLVMSRNQAPKAGEWKIQPLEFPDVKSRRGYVGAVATAGFRLEVAKSSGLAEVPLTFFPKAFPGLQQALRLREPKWTLDLRVEALGQSIQADVFHLYSLKAGAIYGSVLINYFVVGSPATEWRVEVPAGIGNIDVTGQNVGRDWRQSESTVIIPLSRPVLGAGTVLLTFEQPMSAQGGHLDPGAVKPLGVQGERGLIQVVSPLQVNHKLSPEPSGSILAIDPTEIPTEFRLLSTSPTLGAWQYTSRDFKLGMNIEWFNPGETMTQVVDYQKLATHISRDGQWVTDAQVFVKSRGSSVLRMRLQKGAMLWEVKVNGVATNARVDGEHILVPLPPESDPGKALEILLRFGARSGSASNAELIAPQFDVPVVIGEWTIEGDQGRKLLPLKVSNDAASLTEEVADEDGWEWVARHKLQCGILFMMAAIGVLLGRSSAPKWSRVIAVLVGLATIAVSLGFIAYASASSYVGGDVLRYSAPAVQAGEPVTIKVANLSLWAARTGWGVWTGFLLGVALTVRGWMKKDRWWQGCGMALVVASFLSINGGAHLIFLVFALILAVWWMPLLLEVCSML